LIFGVWRRRSPVSGVDYFATEWKEEKGYPLL